MVIIHLLKESLYFALNSLILNKLRTLLSLLGITIGIFAIITVFTVIDALENSIRNSIESLGAKIVYVDKWPWEFSGDFAWWKYMNRPVMSQKDLEGIMERSTKTEAGVFSGSFSKTVSFENNSKESVPVEFVSSDFDKLNPVEIASGRFFSFFESNSGINVAIIGTTLATELFENLDPIGQELKIAGRKTRIIGVFKKEGTQVFDRSKDDIIMVPVNFARNFVNMKTDRVNPVIQLKPKAGVPTEEFLDEIRSIMRSLRRIKPTAEDNFSLNQSSMITQGFKGIFAVIDLAGLVIGGLSILVGSFGIANIMFVSVKEQTKLIGIQKSLGAKNYFVLFQFLFESSLLSLLGGALGLIIVLIGLLIINSVFDMSFVLSMKNLFIGVFISISVGIISGFVPAWQASRLNPIVAMNTL
jgi:putative ABC transport system permease protein